MLVLKRNRFSNVYNSINRTNEPRKLQPTNRATPYQYQKMLLSSLSDRTHTSHHNNHKINITKSISLPTTISTRLVGFCNMLSTTKVFALKILLLHARACQTNKLPLHPCFHFLIGTMKPT
jgi:hypothetical protein